MKRALRLLVVLAVVVGIAGVCLPPAWAGQGNKNKTAVPEFDPENFVDENGDPFPINNCYLPMVPGTTFLYMADAEDEDEAEWNVVYVTHGTKTVAAGVECVVVLDVEFEGDLLVEFTLDWYAQDSAGNIWYCGEDTEAYEYNDEGDVIDISTEGSWEAGVDGAEAGILMLAEPQPGDSYRQEYWEDEAEDMAKVLRLNASASVAYGDYEKCCLVTKEWTPLERGNVEHKFYAPCVGLVLINELKGKTKRVELIAVCGP